MSERELQESVRFEVLNQGETEEVVVEVPWFYIRPERAKGIRLDTKAELGLRLFASGYRLKEAAQISGSTPQRIRALLATDHGKQTIQHIRLELDEEFQGLYRDSIQAFREGLASQDLKVKLDTADKYLKYAKELKVNLVLSAEDLIKAIKDGKVE